MYLARRSLRLTAGQRKADVGWSSSTYINVLVLMVLCAAKILKEGLLLLLSRYRWRRAGNCNCSEPAASNVHGRVLSVLFGARRLNEEESLSTKHQWSRASCAGSSETVKSTRLCVFVFFLGGAFLTTQTQPVQGQGGSWELLVENAGIASMHTAVTRFGTVVFLDRTNIGPSQILLPNGRCRDNPADLVSTHDCSAHSVEFSPGSNRIRPLFIFTDTWCSSGQFLPDGVLLQTGGDNDGLYKIRRFAPCPEADADCDWVEDETTSLQEPRWYATNLLLPDGRQILVGGRSAPNVEFVPADSSVSTPLPLLQLTNDYQQDNLYPFVHLLPNGYLFIFANRDSIIYDYQTATTIASLPTLSGTPRNYPSAGSSVMLPLQSADGYSRVEVLICGGAQLGAYSDPSKHLDASDDCGRIVLSDQFPNWAMETMPFKRTMGDMLLLPTMQTLIISGAQRGSQGWGEADEPAYNPLNYDPLAAPGSRFTILSPSTIPRMYHSTANLLPDGRILIAGSNTHEYYTFTGSYPTELRVEAFSPPYLSDSSNRPAIVFCPSNVGYGVEFTVVVTSDGVSPAEEGSSWNLVLTSSPWSTHSFSQGQRQLNLLITSTIPSGTSDYTITATSPPSAVLATPSYYMLFALTAGIPSQAVWVQIG